MTNFLADLHIHSVLSPCADLEMSPVNILKEAQKKGINLIGVTDHNSTLQCATFLKIASDYNMKILCGTEVTTREEIHCLCFFELTEHLEIFQAFLDRHLPNILNVPSKFGYQLVVDQNDNILLEIPNLLISALDVGINEIERLVHSMNGIFIPAHIDKSKFSIISQLGFIPSDLQVDAIELSKYTSKNEFLLKNKYLEDKSFITNSDAHFIQDIGTQTTILKAENLTYSEIKTAIINL